MKKNISGAFLFSLILLLGLQTSFAQLKEDTSDEVLLEKLKDSIYQDPNNLSLHDRYLRSSGFTKWGKKEDTAFVNQYKRWMNDFPKSDVIAYALGHAYAGKESPKAKPYLLKAIELNPKMDKAYYDLWIDAERWGQFEKGREYIGKASEIKPDDPNYAFYYAGASDRNSEEYIRLSLQVADRFPESERGAQSLYWLAARNKDHSNKETYYQLLKEKYPPSKFNWSSSGMSGYYDLLLISSPLKAEKLAAEMVRHSKDDRSKTQWVAQRKAAIEVARAKDLIKSKKYSGAIQILNSIELSRWSNAKEDLLLLKAKTYSENKLLQEAYKILLVSYANNPANIIGDALFPYGAMIKKNKEQVMEDIWYIRDTASRKGTDFSLNKYFSEGKASLKDFEGKVTLLTYWFPGCGPCRGEFPHFQNVVNKFDTKELAYVGINIVPDQNDYVIPFLKSSGYTFIPLEDYEGREKGNLDNRGAAPVNYLLDGKGNVVFRDFRIDGNNEDVLYNMIESIINR
jgi:thiol-disulfide isomerase/thioredoxin